MTTLVLVENLPPAALHKDVRAFFRGIPIQTGAIKIIGNDYGRALIVFTDVLDADLALLKHGQMMDSHMIHVSVAKFKSIFRLLAQRTKRNLGFCKGSKNEKFDPPVDERLMSESFSSEYSSEETDDASEGEFSDNEVFYRQESVKPYQKRIRPTAVSSTSVITDDLVFRPVEGAGVLKAMENTHHEKQKEKGKQEFAHDGFTTPPRRQRVHIEKENPQPSRRIHPTKVVELDACEIAKVFQEEELLIEKMRLQ